MQVGEKDNFAIFHEASDHVLCVVNGWVQLSAWGIPVAIQVYTCQGATVVPDDDPVGVQHGNDFEDEVVPQYLGVQRGASEVVDHTFHHVR